MIFIKDLKKHLIVLMVILCSLGVIGCGKDSEDNSDTIDTPVDILMVTDYGTVNDGSFNQGTWDGITQYADATGTVCDYYKPNGTSKDDFMEQIKRGVKNGAKVIVCPGYLFEETVYEAQKKYGDVKFILVDGVPHNEDYTDESIGENTLSISFAEEQAGFLAGYAAVRDGYTNLGFMGGVPEDSVIRYGYGFVQGADYAAIEMGVEVNIRYTYTNTFDDIPLVETMAGTWFDDDTEIIFACGGELGRGVIRAAEMYDGKVIGVDIDQSSESEKVVTSAMKSLSEAVKRALDSYSDGTFEGGISKKYSAVDDCVCLPMDTSRFEKFTEVEYESIYTRLEDGTVSPYGNVDIGTTQELTLINTFVTYINI